MCTDSTKQEIAFLISLAPTDYRRTKSELAQDFEKTIIKLGWPIYLEFRPNNISSIIKKSKNFKYIEKVSPFAWSITSTGKDRLTYLIDRFVPEEEREQLRQAAGIYA